MPPPSTSKSEHPSSARVLGIDPGLRLTGYGCVQRAVSTGKRMSADAALIEGGVIRLDGKASIASRLAELDADLREIIQRLEPTVLAVEKLYAHYKHPTTAFIMAHARGVVLLCAQRAGLEIVELGATEVKKSLTGHGHASKEQMQHGVMSQLDLPAPPEPADVADAIAIGLCALRRMG